MRNFFICLGILAGLYTGSVRNGYGQETCTSFVNPMIGTGGHGHTYPGASVPFGMVQLSPDTRLEGWDGCSGYYYADSIIYGFSHTHLSGTGCSDYGDILLMPVLQPVSLNDYTYKCGFEHGREQARPGYYSVILNSGIYTELTATARTGMHRYTFTANAEHYLVLDLKHRDEVLESSLKLLNDSTIAGYRRSKAWASDQRIFFTMVFSEPIAQMLVSTGNAEPKAEQAVSGKNIRALLHFKKTGSNRLLVRVGLSPVSTTGALQNIIAENPGWDFDAIAAKADKSWELELSKIMVATPDKEKKINFYTALYHAFLNPNLYNDHNGEYLGRDLKVHGNPGFDYYTVFSLWDTYRSTHPLYVLTQQKRTVDFIQTFITQYQQGGLLPVWELSSNETFCMIGYHAVPVIADAYMKGVTGFDATKALEAMKHSADQQHQGLDAYRKNGFIASGDVSESVSRTLEYAYDDWCIAQMAKKMGREDDYKTFILRAQSYKHLFDPETGFMRARTNGGWIKPFDPAEVNFNYTEANAWQYSFYVPQDIPGWIRMHGGKQQASAFLDSLFKADSRTTGRNQADITGLIGQYAHGNEPSHHMSYLYDLTGQPWKTQQIVHELQYRMYSNAPDGLCGNEDCGQMSSWYVFSAMGFYPVTPASELYMIGTPLFDQARLTLENGKTFEVLAENRTSSSFYIQSATLNGIPVNRPWITHSEIMQGGTLKLVMGSTPNTSWGTDTTQNRRIPAINDHLVTPAPFVEEGNYVFTDSTRIKLSDAEKYANIYYTLNGTTPDLNSPVFSGSFMIQETTSLKMMARQKGMEVSPVVEASFSRIPAGRSIQIKNPYAPAYAAGGDQALIDYKYGQNDFRTGAWQGYEGCDLDVVLDLGKLQTVNAVSIRFLQDQRSWIFMPESVSFYFSEDGKDFRLAESIKTTTDKQTEGSFTETFAHRGTPEKTRYIRIVAKNTGVCPDWHPGAGEKSWIFTDEITIE